MVQIQRSRIGSGFSIWSGSDAQARNFGIRLCGFLSFHAFSHDLFPAETWDIVPDILSFLFRNPRKLLMDRNHSRCVVIGVVFELRIIFKEPFTFMAVNTRRMRGP